MTISRANPVQFCLRMVQWFIIKQTRKETVMTISCAGPPTVLLGNGSMIHNQMNVDRNGNYQRPF